MGVVPHSDPWTSPLHLESDGDVHRQDLGEVPVL